MDEAQAWLNQAISDWKAAERLAGVDADACHAIAKWQQSVEKAIKAIVAALSHAKILKQQIGYKHEVSRFCDALIRLPNADRHRSIQSPLRGFLDHSTRSRIDELQGLIPKKPPPGLGPQRNTEYPYKTADDRWTYPAFEGAFSPEEIQRFRDLAHRVAKKSELIVSAI